MALHITGPGFSTELEASPKSIFATTKACGPIGFSFADFAYTEAGYAQLAVEGAQIGTCLSPDGVGMGHDGEWRDLHDDAIIVRTPGSVSLSRWRRGFRGQFLVFAPEALERVFHLPLSRIEFADRDIVVEARERPVIRHLLAAISSDLASGNPGGTSFTESLGMTALQTIVRASSEPRRQRRGLTAEQARTIRTLIHDRSAETLSLVDLADALDLSIGHMLRSFKETFGVTPHQYIIRERVETAKSLLETTQMDIDEIVAEAGFTNRAHMTRTFRTLLGVRPMDLRRARSAFLLGRS